MSVQEDIHSQSVNIAWSLFEIMAFDNFSLTVSSFNTQQYLFLAEEPHFVFSTPKGAPACEVYNFSVTATYVGATYTGDGCSLASPVISRMLPSLPDVEKLELSLNYTLEKEGNGTKLSVELVMVRDFLSCTHQSIVINFDQTAFWLLL